MRRRLHLGQRRKLFSIRNIRTVSAWPQRRKVVVKMRWNKHSVLVFLLRQIKRTALSVCESLRTTVRVSQLSWHPKSPAETNTRNVLPVLVSIFLQPSPGGWKRPVEPRRSVSWYRGHVQNEDVLDLSFTSHEHVKTDRRMCYVSKTASSELLWHRMWFKAHRFHLFLTETWIFLREQIGFPRRF